MNISELPGFLALLLWAIGPACTLFGTVYSLRQFRTRRGEVNPHTPAISILKPVKGADSGLEANLESFFQLEYPNFELLFCSMDANDPALDIVDKLRAKYPSVMSHVFVGGAVVGPNPKVNNLHPAYFAAKNDHVLISDSNVRVSPDYLVRINSQLAPGVGVVTSIVAGDFADGVGGYLEIAYLNTFYARWMHLSAMLGVPCVVGKSMYFRKSNANRFGGISIMGRYINEDYMVGKAMQLLGLKVRIAQEPIRQYIGEYSIKDFWLRHIRWGRIRKSQAPLAFLIEPIVTFFGSALVGLVAVRAIAPEMALPFIATHLAIWALAEWCLLREMTHQRRFSVLIAWFLRELLAFPLWLTVLSGNKVVWRGNKLRLRSGGLLAVGS